MLLGMFVMFVLMTLVEGLVAWLVWRRLAAHLRGNAAAVAALTEHLFLPLIGRKG